MINTINEDYYYEVDNERNIYPNMTVTKRYMDETKAEFSGWTIFANDGYVIYNANANNTETIIDPETGDFIDVPVIYYYTATHKSSYYNWNNFNYIAVLRSEVDENYIFGLPGNNHEVA